MLLISGFLENYGSQSQFPGGVNAQFPPLQTHMQIEVQRQILDNSRL